MGKMAELAADIADTLSLEYSIVTALPACEIEAMLGRRMLDRTDIVNRHGVTDWFSVSPCAKGECPVCCMRPEDK